MSSCLSFRLSYQLFITFLPENQRWPSVCVEKNDHGALMTQTSVNSPSENSVQFTDEDYLIMKCRAKYDQRASAGTSLDWRGDTRETPWKNTDVIIMTRSVTSP